MEDCIYILAYLHTEFLNYILAYVVIFGAKLNKNKGKWMITIASIICFHMILLALVGREGSSAMSMLSMLLIPITLLKSIEKKNFLLYPFVAIGTSVIGVCASFIAAVVLEMPEYDIAEGNWLTVICQCFSIFLMLILMIYRGGRKMESFQVNLNWKQYVIFYIVVISLFFMLAPIQILSRIDVIYQDINYIGLSASLACIVLVVVTIWQGIVINREIQLKERNKMYEEYIELQKDYYSQMIEQDEKMRRFRHDMNTHMKVMKAYCDDSDKSELKDYLDSIIKESAINSVESYTGNKGVDAVIRQLLSDAKKQDIIVEINGGLPGKTKIAEYDLCTIISNLLKNAVEACEKIKEKERRNVYVEIGSNSSQIYILVKNQVSGNVIIKNNWLITTKKDNKNHGIGTRNIEEAVKKYDGMLEFYCEEGWFIAEVNI